MYTQVMSIPVYRFPSFLPEKVDLAVQKVHARITDTLHARAQKEVDNSSPQKGNMRTNRPRETGVRRYWIIVGWHTNGKRAKEKRAELESRQNETRQRETRQTNARQTNTRQSGIVLC